MGMSNKQALDTIDSAKRLANSSGESFGGAGGGPAEVRQAINRLEAKPGTPDAQVRFARDLLNLHFDTGLDLTATTNGKAFLDSVFEDFATVNLPGGW